MSEHTMPLGAFSVSLAVKDLAVSRAFYERLGFRAVFGEPGQGWQIMRSGTTTIGLFAGMFERNILTFNPGWDGDNQPLDEYVDVRELQRRLEGAGLRLESRAEEGTTGPGSCMLLDPDGNPILIDQHV